MKDSRAGFTLIELMVVIGIIGLLAAALLPRIIESQETANSAADQANLRYHYATIVDYRTKYKRAPRGGGSQFVIDPWVRGLCEKTEANFDRYWTPGYDDPYKFELKEQGLEEIWQTLDDVQTTDTNYAGRAKEHLRGKFMSGKEALMSNDNEFGAVFLDQSINVLMGSGSVKVLNYDPDLIEYGYDGDGKETWFEVGPDSPHPLLQKLEH